MNLTTIPNNSILAEQSVLGAILKDSERIDDIRFLEERDFSIKSHKILWSEFIYMDSKDLPIDITTIALRLEKFEMLGDIPFGYVIDLMNACPSTSNIVYYAKQVRKNGHRNRLHDLSHQIQMTADADYETEEEMFVAVEELVGDIRPQESGEMLGMKETRAAYKKHLESKAEKLRTGFEQFDEWSQLWREWLYVLAGRPSVGKTAKMLQLVYGVATNNEDAGCILVFTQEMSDNRLKDRLVSMISGVNYVRLTKDKDKLSEKDHEKIDSALDKLDRLKIFIQDKAAVTIDEVRAAVRRFKKLHGKIALVVVDYLQIMKIPEGKNGNRAQAIGVVTAAAKQIARQYNLCFIMLSQMSRDIEKFDSREPKQSDLKESGSIEQDADVIEFLWHKGEMDDGCKVIRSYFAKGRDVGENRFKYKFEWWMQRYKELPKT